MKFSSKETKLTSSQKTMAIELGLADQKKAIELLYSQYSKPIQTCVQELVSNAFDAHKAANKSHVPVKISAPTELNNFMFSVRDFGNSMNLDTIKNVYMRVNASTKSNDNSAIGGFGIGSKTPWAYTDSFVLKTFLDGQETQYLLVKGRSSVNVIYTGKTNEENGVEVTFKARERDVEAFKRAVKRISLCAKVKPLVNFKDSLDFTQRVNITQSISFVTSELLDTNSIYVNVGGVLYHFYNYLRSDDAPWRHTTSYGNLQGFTNNSTIIIDLPIGSLLPLQTREGLFTGGAEGQNNKAMARHIINYALAQVEKYLEDERKKVVCVKSAIDYFAKGLLKDKSRFTFGKIEVTSSELILMDTNRVTTITRNSKQYRNSKNERGRKETSKYLPLKDIKGEIYFSELSGNKARLVSRFHKINQYSEVLVFEKELLDDEVYNTLVKLTNAKNIETVEVPKRQSSGTRSKVDTSKVLTYYYHSGRRDRRKYVSFTESPSTKTIVVSLEKSLKRPYRLYNEVLGYDVIMVAETKVEKLLKTKGYFTEEEAYDERVVMQSFIAHRIVRGLRKLQVDNQDFIKKNLTEAQQNKFNIGSEFKNNRFWGNASHYYYPERQVVAELREKHDEVINRAVKKVLMRRAKAWALAKKAPLAIHTDVNRLPKSAKKDLADYVKAKCGVGHVRG